MTMFIRIVAVAISSLVAYCVGWMIASAMRRRASADTETVERATEENSR